MIYAPSGNNHLITAWVVNFSCAMVLSAFISIEMIAIKQFEPLFAARLPDTLSILESANLAVHPLIKQITLHGSRGLAQNYRPDSDIDLSLLVPFATPPVIGEGLGKCLQKVIDVTLSNWRGPVEVDLAVIFPLHPCNFACFQRTTYDSAVCAVGGTDCFGIYKIQKGFQGFVLNAGIQIERMYPCITVWKQSDRTSQEKYSNAY
jgi:hypothetical protein